VRPGGLPRESDLIAITFLHAPAIPPKTGVSPDANRKAIRSDTVSTRNDDARTGQAADERYPASVASGGFEAPATGAAATTQNPAVSTRTDTTGRCPWEAGTCAY
jgi:hypothetical protein